jgi:hypothetical protein
MARMLLAALTSASEIAPQFVQTKRERVWSAETGVEWLTAFAPTPKNPADRHPNIIILEINPDPDA